MTAAGATGVAAMLRADAQFLAGAESFAQGRYFAAHEHWEHVWLQRDGAEKAFLGALIQVAAGLLKREQGRERGARRLLQRARERLLAVDSDVPVDVARLVRRIDDELVGIERGAEPLPPESLLWSVSQRESEGKEG